EIETSVVILERRGQTLAGFLKRVDAGGQLPVYHVRLGTKGEFFPTQQQVDEFPARESARPGRGLVLAGEIPAAGGPRGEQRAEGWAGRGWEVVLADEIRAAGGPAGEQLAELDERYRFTMDEWHEVTALNRALKKLKDAGFGPADLVPLPRVAGREPAVRYRL